MVGTSTLEEKGIRERYDLDIVADAIRIRHLGFSLIPIKPGAKKPPILWSRYQEKPATPERVRWWLQRRFPGFNYAVVCGQVSSVVAVEADDEEALRLLHEKFPAAPLRQRSRKGEHWLYRWPGPNLDTRNRTKCEVGGKPYNLDVRGDGGYIVGPGSRHASGHIYSEIEPWTAEALAAAPAFDPNWFDPRRKKSKAKPAEAFAPDQPSEPSEEFAGSADGRVRKARRWLRTGHHGSPWPGTTEGQDASGKCLWMASQLVNGACAAACAGSTRSGRSSVPAGPPR
jgi:hypothetical protein